MKIEHLETDASFKKMFSIKNLKIKFVLILPKKKLYFIKINRLIR